MTKRPEKKKSSVVKNEIVQKEQKQENVKQKPISTPQTKEQMQEFIQVKKQTPIVGVKEISDYLGYSMRTVHRWRAEFLDFPVESDARSCVWHSTKEALDEWREKHIDLFFYRKERIEAVKKYRLEQQSRGRRWS